MRPDRSPDRPPDDRSDDDRPPGSIRPTSPVLLAVWAIGGLVVGWLLHPVAERLDRTPPVVTWAQPLALLLVAAILGYAAWSTRRTRRLRPDLLLPHQAVNRLVLARACALVGALVAGGYAGYAFSWIGNQAELADERIVRSLAAAVAGGLVVLAALLLERACRSGPGGDRGASAA